MNEPDAREPGSTPAGKSAGAGEPAGPTHPAGPGEPGESLTAEQAAADDGPSRAAPLRKRLPRFLLPGAGAAFLVAGLALLWLLYAPAGRRDAKADFAILPGMGLSAVSAGLDSLGISTHPRAFLILARLMGVDRGIQPGVFPLEGSMSRRAILLRIRRYAVPGATVRIPEGIRLLETAGLVEKQSHLDSLRFLQLCRDTAFIRTLALPGNPENLEGRLFPDTYLLSTLDTEEVLLTRMARRMEEVFCEVAGDSCAALDRNHVLTLASIVQGEYQIPGEADTIASVYLNRLRIGMKLQADPTVQYLLPTPRRLYYRDLFVDSPYNTYRNTGLPPGPINGPGRIAIDAVLYPAETGYLFFVADGQGGHIFGRTFAEHERNRIPLDQERKRLEELEDSLRSAEATALPGATDTTGKP